MPMKLNIGDIVQTKKNHPCGGNQWEITRTGMDFRIRCTTCKLEKAIKKIIQSTESEDTNK